ncbi:MAG: hypothetical protein COB20_12565 [SAR86 cluster bacterium]|uniref:Uncharacterized protein n=1 Tax=SAR86 cluster bacterium TaxID=2030880 RepID=A0A2A4WZQ9_9GAMM|nr:MAG: hypothetical protein COB20_12565 [SAR86 cluster bacterium]
MNRQKFLQSVLDISTRRKKHEFVQQLTGVDSLPVGIIDIQCQRHRETGRQVTDRAVAGLKLERTGQSQCIHLRPNSFGCPKSIEHDLL